MPRSDADAKRLPPVRRLARWLRQHASACIVAACAALLCAVVLGVHAVKYPNFAGFWAGADQQRYLQAARAWAAGDLAASRHHYLPFYPLLGGAFVRLTPWQPFLIPDLACLLACLALFMRVGRRLAPAWPAGALALCFTVAVLSGRTAAAIWVVPWSTTGAAPWQFAAVLLALRFAEQPRANRAFLLGGCVAVLAGFRPSDAAILLATTGAYAAWALWRPHAGWRDRTTWAGAGLAGLVAGLAPLAWAHMAVFGWSPGPYVSGSASMGFEWRLLPMRWVMIVCGARPLLPEGAGMAWVLPWMAPGIAGMVLAVAGAPRRPAALLVAATVTLHWALYLAYRDMQPYGLWRFYNVHYFKWTFPFLVLWAAQVAEALTRRARRGAALIACAAAVLALMWRPVLRDATTQPLRLQARTIAVPDGALGLNRALWLPLRGGWERAYFGAFTLTAGGRVFENTRDFKILPVSDGVLLLPLRRLPAGDAALSVPDDMQIDGDTIRLARQAIQPIW